MRFSSHLSGSRAAVAGLIAAIGLMLAPAAASAGLSMSGPGFHVHYGARGESDVNACSFALARGAAHCDVHVRTDAWAREHRPARSGGASPDLLGDDGAYDPAYLDSAYDVAAAAAAHGGGQGQTVAVVDAYNDPNVTADLASYRSYFGLPACPVGAVSPAASGCVFEKVSQSGSQSTFPSSSPDWSTEISLDVEMISAICAKCQILLVEANNNSNASLGAAVNEAVSLGANAVSNSWGGEEDAYESTESAAYYDHPGVAITASSGDSGYGVEFPAASRYVTAVGGTSLAQLTDTGTRDGSESAWRGAGAGCSLYEPKPSWQHDSGCSNRTVADVSADANPETGVWVYDTYDAGGWGVYGGTSVASPIIASFYALAGNSRSSAATLAEYPYDSAEALYDVTSGSDGSCSPAYLCTAGPGYDGPTGLGTPGGAPDSIAAFGPGGSPPPPPPPPVAPGAPVGLTATAGSGQVQLSWSPPATGTAPLTYDVYESSTSASSGFSLLAAGSNLAGTGFTATGLTDGAVYYFRVTAANSVGEGPASSVVSATPTAKPTAPGPPLNLTATGSSKGIALSWQAPASDGGSPVTSYILYRSTASGQEARYGVVTCTAATCTARDPATVYSTRTFYYEVAAVNAVGIGGRSNEASAKA